MVVTGDERALDAALAKDVQRQFQDQLAIALALEGRPDAVAGMAADLHEEIVQPVADADLADGRSRR